MCGSNNIRLRGHHDDVNLKSLISIDDIANDHEVQKINHQNIGIYKGLLFRIDSGDEDLKKMTFVSKTIQN